MFLQEIGEYMQRTRGIIDFSPRFVNWACKECTPSFKEQNCISNGEYCANFGVSNSQYKREVVMEDLRMHCIWAQVYGTN